jgi:enoyl-CoA hydratase
MIQIQRKVYHMAYETILYEVEDNVGILTLNRPEMVNAINRKMAEELADFWNLRHQDTDVRVIVFRGAGERGFSSGLDIKEVMELHAKRSQPSYTPSEVLEHQTLLSKVFRLMRSAPQPIIAVVHGAAIGGGLSFAYTSDIRLASTDAVFRAQFINIGVGGADMGSSFFLWRIVGWGKAAEMCLTGDKVSAAEALRIGLVNYLYPREELFPAAMAMAKRMATKNRIQLQLTKEALNMALNGIHYEDVIRIEDRNQTILSLGADMNAMGTLQK